LLALLLFPLPWVQVQCSQPIDNRGTKLLVEQSGLQAAYGGYSENPQLREGPFESQRESAHEGALKKDGGVRWSGWMIVYPLLLAGGVVAGILVWKQPLRSAVLIGCSAAAGLVLLIQTRVGFPLEQAMPQPSPEQIKVGDLLKIEATAPKLLVVRYTEWFWLSVAAVVVAACLEVWVLRQSTRRHGFGGSG
jgi:hypothetical protein